MKNNLTEIRKKKSFWHLFVKMNTEIQVIFTVILVASFFAGLTACNYYTKIPEWLFSIECVSSAQRLAVAVEAATIELAVAAFIFPLAFVLWDRIQYYTSRVKIARRFTHLPLTKEEESKVGITADPDTKEYYEQWIFFLFTDIFNVQNADGIKKIFYNGNDIYELKLLLIDNPSIKSFIEWLGYVLFARDDINRIAFDKNAAMSTICSGLAKRYIKSEDYFKYSNYRSQIAEKEMLNAVSHDSRKKKK